MIDLVALAFDHIACVAPTQVLWLAELKSVVAVRLQQPVWPGEALL